MSSIFISHSSKDNDLAKELERELAKQNHASVFLDIDPEKGIVGGQSWERTLYRKLRACKAVIALCTDSYLASRWCFAEIALARMEGKPIFALKCEGLSDNASLPSILTENQYIRMQPNPQDGYRRLWLGLKEIDLLGVSGEWNPNEPPYLGLNFFDEKHAPVFFGREDEARAGVELLDRGSPNLIMTIGGSGSGKSSLVRAGILPRLRQDPDRWIIIEPFRPGSNPFMQLAGALIRSYRRYAPDNANRVGDIESLAERLELSAGRDGDNLETEADVQTLSDDERVQRLLTQLEELHLQPPSNAHGKFLKFLDWSLDDLKRICDNPDGLSLNIGASILVELAEDLRVTAKHPHASVLLVIDQFEEFLARKTTKAIMHDFLRLLRTTLESDTSPIMVLGTMRSDFLSRFQHSPELRGIDFESLSLGPMRIEGIRRVIEEPAKLAALELEEGLADKLIEDTGNASALPLLSFTLWKLWRDFREDGLIEIKEYEQLGGLEGSIASEANGLLKPTEEDALRIAFLSMVRLTEDGVYARQPIPWDSDALKPVHDTLEKFIRRRLLVSLDHGGVRIVEVAHESLFHAWKPLRQWLQTDRADLMLKQDLRRDTKAWMDSGKSRDYLWRGARLTHANILLKNGELEKAQKKFVRMGGRRRALLVLAGAITGGLMFFGMAGFSYQSEIAREEADQSFEMIITTATTIAHEILTANAAVPGKITVDQAVFEVDGEVKNDYVLVRGFYGEGRVIAVAHPGALSNEDLKTKMLLHPILAWAIRNFESKAKVVFSVGHCEIVSDSKIEGYSLPMQTLKEWGYEPHALDDFSRLPAMSNSTMLIIGGAWGSFTEEEISSVKTFVKQGGSLVIAGLKWSWDAYKKPGSGFNPCSFTTHSANRTVATDAYPINQIARPFGIQWEK